MRGNDRVETQPFACQDDLEKRQYTNAIPTEKDLSHQVCSFILTFFPPFLLYAEDFTLRNYFQIAYSSCSQVTNRVLQSSVLSPEE